jgi:hypothetical protein
MPTQVPTPHLADIKEDDTNNDSDFFDLPLSDEDKDQGDPDMTDEPSDPPSSDRRHVTLPPLYGAPLWQEIPGREEAAYYHLYPSGRGGALDPERPVPLTAREYNLARLFGADARFGGDSSWVFARLHELNKADLTCAISFILNHGYEAVHGMTATQARAVLRQQEWTPEAIRQQLYPQVSRRIRNSPSYWAKARRSAFTMIKNIGCPHVFMTYSPDDLGNTHI